MQIRAAKKGRLLQVKLMGELDHHSAPRFAEQMDAMIEHGADIRILQLDLGELTFMDSSGIGVLMGRYKRMAQLGGSLQVRNESRNIERIMRLTGLYQVIEHIG